MTLPVKFGRTRPVTPRQQYDRDFRQQEKYYSQRGYPDANVDRAADTDMQIIARLNRKKRMPLSTRNMQLDEN